MGRINNVIPFGSKPSRHAGCMQTQAVSACRTGAGDVPSQARWAGSQLQPGSRKGRDSKRPLSLLVLGMDTLEKRKGYY